MTIDTKYAKAFWLARNLASVFYQTVGGNDDAEDENLASLRRSIELFARNLNIELPRLPDTSTDKGIARALDILRNSVRQSLVFVQSDLVAKCYEFGFDYSTWILWRVANWDEVSYFKVEPTEQEITLRGEAKRLGIQSEFEACLGAAKNNALSAKEFKKLTGYDLVLRMTEKLERLDPGWAGEAANSNQLFIVMPMLETDPALDDVVETITEVASSVGLAAYRVDQLDSSGRITDSIINGLKSAGHVVVDLTHARPNVYWEAGFCHGLGKLPVYIARKGTLPEFDVKDYPVIYYSNMKQLRQGLKKRLAKQLES
jgi:hypothetical protein